MSNKLNKISNIEPVSDVDIDSLFLIPVTLTENQTITDAIGNLQQGEKLVLISNTNEDIDISQDCVIEAENVTFSGTITINNNASVTFIGAIFEQPVIIA
jgi:glyceraldehyde-3-phosphate dehydrogenase/erythrose-4-phosphate dehydrogenase